MKNSSNDSRLRAYYRLTKPGIIYGNGLTAIGGFLLASDGQIGWSLLAATLGGMALVIASACVFNNYLDRGLDAAMTRTKNRALVSGTLSTQSALIFATILGLMGFLILGFYVSSLVLSIGIAAHFLYVVVYGLAKRRSVWGTVVGSLPGAASVVAGYTAVTGQLDSGALILVLILVLWQMPHFYAIAMYRFKDYKAAGLPVLPVEKGMVTTKRQIRSYIVAFIAACGALSVFGYTGYIFLLILSSVGLYWLYLGVRSPQVLDNTVWGRKMFLFSLVVIVVLSTMLSLNAWLP